MSSAVSPEHRVSVVIPTHDTRELTICCVECLLASGFDGVEVLVVDDGSKDGTGEALRTRFPSIRVLGNERPRGFTASVNRGLAAADGRILLLLNSDTEVDPEALEELDRTFRRRPDLGVAGATLRYPDGTPQWSGGGEPSLLWLFGLASGLPALIARIPGVRALRPVRGTAGEAVDWVTGAAMAFRREVLDQVGPLDEGFRLYCQDLDFCTRARKAGWDVAVVPDFRVVHHHGATIGRSSGAAGRQDPEHLWADLVRWSLEHRGAAWARRAARVLRAGGRLRLAGRALVGLLRGVGERAAWQRDSLRFRRALVGVREAIRQAASSTNDDLDQP